MPKANAGRQMKQQDVWTPHINTTDTPQVELTCNCSASTKRELSKFGNTAFKGNKTSVHPVTQKDGQDFVEALLLFPKLAQS